MEMHENHRLIGNQLHTFTLLDLVQFIPPKIITRNRKK